MPAGREFRLLGKNYVAPKNIVWKKNKYTHTHTQKNNNNLPNGLFSIFTSLVFLFDDIVFVMKKKTLLANMFFQFGFYDFLHNIG